LEKHHIELPYLLVEFFESLPVLRVELLWAEPPNELLYSLRIVFKSLEQASQAILMRENRDK
jgi:hypothetical protein